MEFNRYTIVIAVVVLLGLGAIYIFAPQTSPTALVSGVFEPRNTFVSKVSDALHPLFDSRPQSFIEMQGRVGILLPGGTSIQFATQPEQTALDVVIILNASNAALIPKVFHAYPEFVSNEFTYIPPEQLQGEDAYVRAQYPNGVYALPTSLE